MQQRIGIDVGFKGIGEPVDERFAMFGMVLIKQGQFWQVVFAA